MTNEEITSCIQTLRFLENNFINDHGKFMNDEHPDNIEKIIKFFKEKCWIAVSERLPEEGQYVLVTSHGRIHLCLADSYGTVTVVMPIISKDATEIVFHPQPDWGDGYAAWMPLPEPYQSND